MPLEKPASVENDAFKSAKWDEITHARNFTSADAPVIALLCQWYKVIEQAQDELDGFGEQTAYTNALGDLKAFPQIATLKTASAEIRALNKQLGIQDGRETQPTQAKITKLEVIQQRRAASAAKAKAAQPKGA